MRHGVVAIVHVQDLFAAELFFLQSEGMSADQGVVLPGRFDEVVLSSIVRLITRLGCLEQITLCMK